MDELIRDLEAATEGSRALDVDIHRFLHPIFDAEDLDDEDKRGIAGVENYTTSLDAAQTLVEPCHMVTLRFETPDEGSDTMASAEIMFTAEDPRFYGVSTTPALALCIAAIKARQATSRAAAKRF